jgi:hypothetical protein
LPTIDKFIKKNIVYLEMQKCVKGSKKAGGYKEIGMSHDVNTNIDIVQLEVRKCESTV